MSTYDTLVLSGNSTNGLLTLGALQKLFDDKILCNSMLTSYYGTSSGAIICTLLALGYEPIEILAYICINKSYAKISTMNLSNLSYGGLLNFDTIEREIDNIIITKLGFIPTMNCVRERFGKNLYLTTYNLSSGSKEILSAETYPNLLVTKAMRMSSTFPFIFPPFEYDNKYYLDGGIVENFPMHTAQKSNRNCFGLYNINTPKPYTLQTNYFELFVRLLTVFVSSSAEFIQTLPGCKIMKLAYNPGFFNFMSSNSDLLNMFDDGYKICKEELHKS